ncbi:TPR-like protein [Thozetella sp. PMI_491]|nr:TPR-like protein [Thozetella sp. PMI_491]
MENLAKDTERKLNIADGDGGSHQPGANTQVPDLPPSLALTAGKTVDEVFADLNQHPLFMTELDDNDEVAALQALAYDGTPFENATNFKEQGNESFREKRWADAKEFYSNGINLLVAEARRRARGEKPKPEQLAGLENPDYDLDSPEEVQNETTLLEQLYVNRAACNLELKNYRSCTLDCASALRLNPSNVKAFYRSSRALLALKKLADADDAVSRGLAIDKDNVALAAVAKEVAAKNAALQQKDEKEQLRLETQKHQKRLLWAAIRARGIRTRFTEKPPEMGDVQMQLLPDPSDPNSHLSFPTVLLYPVQLESDFIKAFSETESLEQHFGYVFPLPWDREEEYATNSVECYMETVSGGLIKVGKKVPLLKVLCTGKVEVVDELVKIFVVPKGKADVWVKDFKAKKALEKPGQK